MSTFKQYALQAWDAYEAVGPQFGHDVRQADVPTRSVALSACLIFGSMMKLLEDKGLITEAEITAVFGEVAGGVYPQLPYSVYLPDGAVDLPNPDLGV